MTFQLTHIQTSISYEDSPARHVSWHLLGTSPWRSRQRRWPMELKHVRLGHSRTERFPNRWHRENHRTERPTFQQTRFNCRRACGWTTWDKDIQISQRSKELFVWICLKRGHPETWLFFPYFSSKNGRLETIRFANTPKEHVSVDVYIPSHLPYPTISLPPHTVILQYPYYISIVSQNIPILSPTYPISKVSSMNYWLVVENPSEDY